MEFSLIDESNYQAEMEGTVLPALARCRQEGWFDPTKAERDAGLEPLTDGGFVVELDSTTQPIAQGTVSSTLADERNGKLHYLAYDAGKFDEIREQGATASFRGCIVISHGFTEFAEKYDELVWYFLLAGYSVCVLEHRGHGKSERNVDNPSMVWIDDWQRYVVDLAAFASSVGQQYAGGMPLNLFCHSMGGGIGAALLERYPSLFDKAVLSAPMIAPQTGMPLWLTRGLVGALCALGMGRQRVFGQKDFDGVLDLSSYQYSSEARERWYHKLRCEHPEYQTYCATFSWVREALRLNRAILQPEACAEIETPLLLFQAGRDVWVLNKPQNTFVQRVKDGGGEAQLVRFAESQHEIFSMPNATYQPYLERILNFYDDPMIASASY
ncbi:alpha/beta fold hydrolase [Bifidobacterium oedipodis]|uniref:Alpha/beta hydrolase fold protein n=1 Tax=Bifidobacterium oedipodis TaxID=2675322 RepID=A0A7Y0HU26_9BIFI|nr:alpha/beta fold hydrolase [Bifidobacterium sp. DSM 109957]NMM94712.1 Alpha/beta hydrolase fold protein [Bifidobacterium sp. DSM 109957]